MLQKGAGNGPAGLRRTSTGGQCKRLPSISKQIGSGHEKAQVTVCSRREHRCLSNKREEHLPTPDMAWQLFRTDMKLCKDISLAVPARRTWKSWRKMRRLCTAHSSTCHIETARMDTTIICNQERRSRMKTLVFPCQQDRLRRGWRSCVHTMRATRPLEPSLAQARFCHSEGLVRLCCRCLRSELPGTVFSTQTATLQSAGQGATGSIRKLACR